MADFITAYQLYYQQNPRSIYLQCSASEVPCPEALGYTQGKTLGSGTYAKVKAAWSPYERKMIAIKNLHKKAASKDYLTKFLPREIEVLQMVHHPNILQVYQIIESEDKCYFMLEIAENGDLLDYINSRGRIPEEEARSVFKQMASAIDFCHSIGVVHRDLKCENVMISRDMQIKVGDFGFAVHTLSPVFTPCGSYSYAAPELFTSQSKGYDGKKADVWSLGVILYAMVCGRLPFGDDAQVKKTRDRVLTTFSRNISTDCRNLLRCVLHTNPEKRISCADILKHPWTSLKTRSPSLLQAKAKYTLQNCLPMIVYQQQPMAVPQHHEITPHPQLTPIRGHSSKTAARKKSTAEQLDAELSRSLRIDAHAARALAQAGPQADTPRPKSDKQHRQIVAKIGAAGRKLADAMRHVSQSSKGHLEDSTSSARK